MEPEQKQSLLNGEKKPPTKSMVTDPGVYALWSNMPDWDEEKLWRTYIMLTDFETVFRSLKSELGLRPVFHHKQERSEARLFITVLAYQFVQIRKRLCEKGIKSSWSTLRMELASQCRVTATFRRADGRTMNIREATLPDPGAKKNLPGTRLSHATRRYEKNACLKASHQKTSTL